MLFHSDGGISVVKQKKIKTHSAGINGIFLVTGFNNKSVIEIVRYSHSIHWH